MDNIQYVIENYTPWVIVGTALVVTFFASVRAEIDIWLEQLDSISPKIDSDDVGGGV